MHACSANWRGTGCGSPGSTVAPEAPDQPSRGRKPSPQFLWDARDEFGVDLTQSYFVGDKLIDLECGWNAGVKQAFWFALDTVGGGKERATVRERAVVVDDLTAVADDLNRGTSRQADESTDRHRMKIIGIIPARYASTRFPGKPLALIAGKPLIQRVVEQCRKARLSEVIVATDDERIAAVPASSAGWR